LKRIFLATSAALLLLLASAVAEPTAEEQRIRELAQKHPQGGVVFMEVKVFEEGKEQPCPQVSVSVVSDEGYSGFFFTQKPAGLSGQRDFGGFGVLPPGTYTIVSVSCQFTARLNGKFARFRLGSNEIINAGRLVVDFKRGPQALFTTRKFTGRTSVEGLEAKAIESITKRTPTTFLKATKRYMTPNPATSGKRPS
jgi:hypothetical protein